MDLQRQFGQRVRELRARQSLTQRELAARCGGGFFLQRIGEIERGEANCTLQTVAALCKGLRCDPLDLFLFQGTKIDKSPSLPNRRLLDLWNAANDAEKAKILRVLAEILA